MLVLKSTLLYFFYHRGMANVVISLCVWESVGQFYHWLDADTRESE